MRACVRACVRAYVRACVRACVIRRWGAGVGGGGGRSVSVCVRASCGQLCFNPCWCVHCVLAVCLTDSSLHLDIHYVCYVYSAL